MSSFKRFVIGFDPHGDQQHGPSNKVFFKFIDQFKPHYRIAGGDVFDFRPLRGKATLEEKQESLRPDRDAGLDWLELLRPTHFLLGNHDHRLWLNAEKSDGVLSDYCRQGVEEIEAFCRKIKCRILPYHKSHGVLRLGRMKVIHGFWAGLHADKQAALCYGSVLMGHTHTVSQFATPGLDRRVARSCGALCNLDMDYNSTMPSSLRHAHGFVYGIIDEVTGMYHVWQAEPIGGKWILPSDMTEL